MKKTLYFVVFIFLFAFAATLTVFAAEAPQITVQPEDVSVTVGGEAILSCSAETSETDGELRYAWYSCLGIGDEGAPVTNPLSDGGVYLPDTSVPGAFHYYCMVFWVTDDSAEMVRSDTVTVFVTGEVEVDYPVIENELDDFYSVPQGGELVLSIECNEQPEPVALDFSWYIKPHGESAFSPVEGADGGDLVFPTDEVGRYSVMCRITASYGDKSMTTQSKQTEVTVEAHEHEFGEWETVTSPTCMTDGEEERACSCGKTESRVLESPGHSFGEWTVTLEPAKGIPGKRMRTCSECALSEIEEIPALPDEDDTTEHRDTSAYETRGPRDTESGATENTDIAPITSARPETSGEEPTVKGRTEKKYFPFWTLIIVFGILVTVGAGCASAFYFLKFYYSAKREDRRRSQAAIMRRMSENMKK